MHHVAMLTVIIIRVVHAGYTSHFHTFALITVCSLKDTPPGSQRSNYAPTKIGNYFFSGALIRSDMVVYLI